MVNNNQVNFNKGDVRIKMAIICADMLRKKTL